MYPISNERLSWVEARIFLLGRMISELTRNQSRYQSNQRYGALHPQVMQELYAEQLKLNIERNALTEYLEEEKAAKLVKDQAATALSQGSYTVR